MVSQYLCSTVLFVCLSIVVPFLRKQPPLRGLCPRASFSPPPPHWGVPELGDKDVLLGDPAIIRREGDWRQKLHLV